MKFEINFYNQIIHKGEVLVDVPCGKSYSTAPNHFLDQRGQKGFDCWYYAMNFLRQRYGRFASQDNPHRKFEKLVSQYRRSRDRIEKYNALIIFFQNPDNILDRNFFYRSL